MSELVSGDLEFFNAVSEGARQCAVGILALRAEVFGSSPTTDEATAGPPRRRTDTRSRFQHNGLLLIGHHQMWVCAQRGQDSAVGPLSLQDHSLASVAARAARWPTQPGAGTNPQTPPLSLLTT